MTPNHAVVVSRAAKFSSVTIERLSGAALLVSAVVILAPRVASAQQWVCYPFSAGETAADAALRIVGDAGYGHPERFQILDVSTSKFVARSRHDRIRPGWVACAWTNGGPVQVRIAATAVTGGTSPPFRSGEVAGLRPVSFWSVLIILVMMSFALHEVERRRKHRRAAIDAMTRFGKSVIREFEQPLTQPRDPRPALRARLRMRPLRRRLEVLLAPVPGRSYPNLSDHRKNVEYDLERVRQSLNGEPFVNDSVRQRGEWVVLRFRFTARQTKAGAR